MRFVLACAIVLFLCSCTTREQKNQFAADAIAGVDAASALIAEGQPEAAGVALSGVPSRVENAVETPRSELPAPAIPVAAIKKDPAKYAADAPPTPAPWGVGVWSAIGTGALAALFALKKVAPLVPGLGSTVGGVADIAWGLLAHADQKKTDAVQQSVVQAAAIAAPALANFSQIPEVAPYISPELAAAINTLRQANAKV